MQTIEALLQTVYHDSRFLLRKRKNANNEFEKKMKIGGKNKTKCKPKKEGIIEVNADVWRLMLFTIRTKKGFYARNDTKSFDKYYAGEVFVEVGFYGGKRKR